MLAVRLGDRWSDCVVIPRATLHQEREANDLGTVIKDKNVILYLSFGTEDVICSKQNLQRYRNNFGRWPSISH